MALNGRSKWFAGALTAGAIAFAVGVGVGPGGGGGAIDAGALPPPADAAAGGEDEINLAATWSRHTIVAGAPGSPAPNGADGTQLGDADGDGLQDVVTGHEQGLIVTLSFNPGEGLVPGEGLETDPWPTVTLPASGTMCSPEDAILADVDADGALDIVAACETGTNRVVVFFAPAPPNTRSDLLVAANWTRVELTASATASARYMRAAVVDIAGDGALEIVVGGKESSSAAAKLGYFASATPRTGASWTFTEIAPVGWVTQMYAQDLDGDSDIDIVYTDYDPIDEPERDTTKRGLRWMENLGGGTSWEAHQISPIEGQHRWFSLADWDGDSDLDIMECRSSPPSINTTTMYANGGNFASFTPVSIPMPAGVGSCIHPVMVDLDVDGALDIAWSFAQATNLEGVAWVKRAGSAFAPVLSAGHVAGVVDVDSDTKFDNLAVTDVDGDGDPDLITSEQHLPDGTGPGLGVVWFENPLGSGSAPVADAGPPDASVPDAAPGGGGAIACTGLTSGSGTASLEAVTASVDPTDNAVVLVGVIASLAAGPPAPTSVVGNGLTYEQVNTATFHTGNGRRISLWRGMGASPSAGAITVTWEGSTLTSFQWVVIECTGVATGGNGANAVAQSTTNTASAATSVAGTLAALAEPSSVHVALSGISINGAQTADAAFAELLDTNVGTGASGLMIEWATNETVATPTFASANAGIISVELVQ